MTAVPADGWWSDMEQEVLACLGARGASPAHIAASLGVSEAAVCSVIAMLVEDGKVRIERVALAVEGVRGGELWE